MIKKPLLILAILLIGAFVLSACGAAETEVPTEPVAEEPALSPMDKVIEEAKNEGKLIVYTSYNVEQGETIHNAFMEKYPFITVEHVSVGGPDVASRIALEVSGGTAGADIGLTGINFLQSLVNEGHLQTVDWASLGISEDQIESEYLMKVATITFTLVWNTDLVPDGLTGWEDLLDPSLKGQVGQWVNGEPFAYLVPAWGETKVDEFLTDLLANDPIPVSGLTTVFDMLSAGEIAAGFGNGSNLLGYKAKGAPIDGIWAEPIPVINYDAGIPINAAHPNAAMLYAAWLVSPEGAAIYEEATGRGNVFVPTTNIAQMLEGKEFSTFSADKMDEANALVKKYKAMIEETQ
jgi:iron(III) transport system substrate-binding protein